MNYYNQSSNVSPDSISQYKENLKKINTISSLDLMPYVSLEEALNSEYPVYSKAVLDISLLDLGISPVKDVIKNKDGILFDDVVIFTKPVYVYNLLMDIVSFYRTNSYLKI